MSDSTLTSSNAASPLFDALDPSTANSALLPLNVLDVDLRWSQVAALAETLPSH